MRSLSEILPHHLLAGGINISIDLLLRTSTPLEGLEISTGGQTAHKIHHLALYSSLIKTHHVAIGCSWRFTLDHAPTCCTCDCSSGRVSPYCSPTCFTGCSLGRVSPCCSTACFPGCSLGRVSPYCSSTCFPGCSLGHVPACCIPGCSLGGVSRCCSRACPYLFTLG